MDQQQSSILSFVSITLSVLGTVFGLLNGHRIRSNCCGRKSSLEIDDITPKKTQHLIDKDAHFSDTIVIPT
jgi:hypothetical protein